MFINQENLAVVKTILDREKKGDGAVGYSNDEIVLLVRAFRDLIDIGNLLGLEMLSAWAVNQYSHFSNVFWARGIDVKLIHDDPSPNIRQHPWKPDDAAGVSPHWVLNCLAGMKFIRKNGNRELGDKRESGLDQDAYDYMKKRLGDEGFKPYG